MGIDYKKEKEKNKILYAPKRVVNNKQSNVITHLIGLYLSIKNEGPVWFESQAEMDAYLTFELSSIVWDFRPQPVEVEIKVHDKKGEPDTFMHYPDTLVFVENLKPCLYQIKNKVSKSENKADFIIIDRECRKYAKENGYDYKLIHMDKLDKNFKWNVRFLYPFLNEDRANEAYSESILAMVSENQSIKIDELADRGVAEVERQYVLPVIFHEIAKGVLFVDLTQRIDGNSPVRLATEDDVDFYDFIWRLQ